MKLKQMETFNRLTKLDELTREACPGISWQQFHTFVNVVKNEGKSLVDLHKIMKVPKASTQKNLRILSHYGSGGKPGYGLVMYVLDDWNPNKKNIMLTDKGAAFAERIIEILDL